MKQPGTIEKFANGKASAVLLNLLLPGAGHVYFKEYVFGTFVLLISLLAAGLIYLTLLIELNFWAKLILFGLPLVFYFFTFFDLINSINRKKERKTRGFAFSVIIYVVALSYQALAPTAPVNFMITNGPIPFVLNNNRLAPVYAKGTLMKISRLSYSVKILGLGRPVIHHLPERYDIVRFRIENGSFHNAVVLGLPQEVIELIDGTVIINGLPDFEGWMGGVSITGSMSPLTVADGNLLVATLNLGAIDEAFQISLNQIIGKVEAVF